MTKNLKISLIILGILIGIYILNNNYQNKLIANSTAIFNENAENIYKILIQQGENAIELTKSDTTWKISGNDTLVIKKRSIDNIFNKILKVNKGTIISENPEKYIKYSIDDSIGTHLALIDSKDKTIGYYIFGKSNSDYSRSYIRINNDPKVYLADENVLYLLSTNENYWGEIPKEEITAPVPNQMITDSTIINN